MKATWPKKPKRTKHPMLGTRQTWVRSDGLAMIDRFLGGTRRFIPAVAEEPGGDCRPLTCHVRTLAGAQRICQQALGRNKKTLGAMGVISPIQGI